MMSWLTEQLKLRKSWCRMKIEKKMKVFFISQKGDEKTQSVKDKWNNRKLVRRGAPQERKTERKESCEVERKMGKERSDREEQKKTWSEGDEEEVSDGEIKGKETERLVGDDCWWIIARSATLGFSCCRFAGGIRTSRAGLKKGEIIWKQAWGKAYLQIITLNICFIPLEEEAFGFWQNNDSSTRKNAVFLSSSFSSDGDEMRPAEKIQTDPHPTRINFQILSSPAPSLLQGTALTKFWSKPVCWAGSDSDQVKELSASWKLVHLWV